MKERIKNWLTLNAHGKSCLENFIYAISGSDVWSSKLDYLISKGLVDHSINYRDYKEREEVAGHCLTDLGLHTVVHYFPKFSPHLNKKATLSDYQHQTTIK